MSNRDLIERLRQAKLDRYPHGGARLAVINGNDRELIADFYGDGEWTEFFEMLIRHAIADHTPGKETCAHQHPDRKPDDTYCRDCGEHF